MGGDDRGRKSGRRKGMNCLCSESLQVLCSQAFNFNVFKLVSLKLEGFRLPALSKHYKGP